MNKINKWRMHIATGSMVVALSVAFMVPGLALAQTGYGNQGAGTNSNSQMNGSSGPNSNGQMGSGSNNGLGNNMGSGNNMNPGSNNGLGMSHGNMSNVSRHEVMQIQSALNQSGDHLSVDGIMGPHTRSALRSYQRLHGLQPTGKPDPQTLQRLGVNQ